jgi:hypothetical protein
MPGGGDDITQIPGNISCFGCNITAVSVPTLATPTTGDTSKSVTITFTANQPNVVIAYGSHISTRADWGLANSAINISGSPYHNFISATTIPDTNQGNRDLQLSAEAVIFAGKVTIIKSVTTLPDMPGDPPGTTSTFVFTFNASANLGDPDNMFTLVDNVSGPGGGGTASQAFGDLFFFGAANPITVMEAAVANWTLSGIVCRNDATGNPHAGSSTNLDSRTATIILAEGDFVTCTFSNTQFAPTAAPASVSGRVLDSFGNGIGGARLTMSDAQSGETWSTLSNPFGYYTLEGAGAGNFYIMSISHKRYSFAVDTRTFTLNEDLVDVDWVANP